MYSQVYSVPRYCLNNIPSNKHPRQAEQRYLLSAAHSTPLTAPAPLWGGWQKPKNLLCHRGTCWGAKGQNLWWVINAAGASPPHLIPDCDVCSAPNHCFQTPSSPPSRFLLPVYLLTQGSALFITVQFKINTQLPSMFDSWPAICFMWQDCCSQASSLSTAEINAIFYLPVISCTFRP